MDLKKIAKSILAGLNQLNNNSSAIDKISHQYPKYQIEIILEHLRKIQNARI